MIATILTTKCREAGADPSRNRISRQFSRQSVASCYSENSGATEPCAGKSRHLSRHFGGIKSSKRENSRIPTLIRRMFCPASRIETMSLGLAGQIAGHFVRPATLIDPKSARPDIRRASPRNRPRSPLSHLSFATRCLSDAASVGGSLARHNIISFRKS